MAAGENYPLFSSISNCPMIVYLRAVRIRTLVRNACRSHPRVKTVSHVYPRETRRQNIGSFTFLWTTNIFGKKQKNYRNSHIMYEHMCFRRPNGHFSVHIKLSMSNGHFSVHVKLSMPSGNLQAFVVLMHWLVTPAEPQMFSSVQSLDRVVRRGDMRDGWTKILFESFLQEVLLWCYPASISSANHSVSQTPRFWRGCRSV